ncbi:MAG: hypothetical protein QHJ73_05190, partial [Armatimonadota bacterium]|nr:hypothetical protein [Armatimonadota bacterium]
LEVARQLDIPVAVCSSIHTYGPERINASLREEKTRYTRNPVAINPGTVQACAIHLYGGPNVYDYYVSRVNGIAIHAPGALTNVRDAAGRVAFVPHAWVERPYSVLVSGLSGIPTVRVDGTPVALEEPHRFVEGDGLLVLSLSASPRVELSIPTPRTWTKE